MKLAELGLKTKPATKYFDHGYIKFRTNNKELSYEIWIFKNKSLLMRLLDGVVKDQEHLKYLMDCKSVSEAMKQ